MKYLGFVKCKLGTVKYRYYVNVGKGATWNVWYITPVKYILTVQHKFNNKIFLAFCCFTKVSAE